MHPGGILKAPFAPFSSCTVQNRVYCALESGLPKLRYAACVKYIPDFKDSKKKRIKCLH